ncbi:hypothetical protein [Streptomyces sp. SGAir0957]
MQEITLAASWVSILAGVGSDFKELVFKVFIPLLCGIFVLVVGFRTKAPGPTILAVIFAGIVWGLSANLSSLSDITGETVNQYDGGGATEIFGGDH